MVPVIAPPVLLLYNGERKSNLVRSNARSYVEWKLCRMDQHIAQNTVNQGLRNTHYTLNKSLPVCNTVLCMLKKARNFPLCMVHNAYTAMVLGSTGYLTAMVPYLAAMGTWQQYFFDSNAPYLAAMILGSNGTGTWLQWYLAAKVLDSNGTWQQWYRVLVLDCNGTVSTGYLSAKVLGSNSTWHQWYLTAKVHGGIGTWQQWYLTAVMLGSNFIQLQ